MVAVILVLREHVGVVRTLNVPVRQIPVLREYACVEETHRAAFLDKLVTMDFVVRHDIY